MNACLSHVLNAGRLTRKSWAKAVAEAPARRQTRSSLRSISRSRLGEYCHGDAGNAGWLPLVVAQVDLPDMRGASDVNRARDAGHPALADAAQVVGIDLQADRAVPRRRGASRAAGAEHLGEQDGYAAMQDPHRLARARIDRRPGAQEVVAHLEKLDAEMRDRRVHVDRGQGFDRDRTLPDRRHGERIVVAIISPTRTARSGVHSGLNRSRSFGNNSTIVEPSKKRPISSPFSNSQSCER